MNQYLKNLDAVLISNISDIIYLTKDFGFSEKERECLILVTKKRKIIITDARYSFDVRKNIKDFELIESGANIFIRKDAGKFFEKNSIKRVGIDEDNLTVAEYKSLKRFVKLTPVDLSGLRIIKRSEEIKKIKKACEIGDRAFEFILGQIKLSVSEKEIAQRLEGFIKRKNADLSFRPIIAFGKNSAVPHHLSGNTKLSENQIILLDFGVKVENYCSDMTRTVFFGKAPGKFKNMYRTVLSAQTNAIKTVKTGIKASEIDKIARDYIINQNFPNIGHAVGHGVGIDVHEPPILSPSSKDIINNGMLFSVEPGIYIPGYGGVRIEDIVVVRDGYAELISKAKREIIELNVG